jgi:hypothetical protein
MNFAPIGRSLAPYRAAIRQPLSSVVEQSYGNGQQARVSTDVASLSLETRLDLSQKAQVLPPPPPTESKRKTSPAPARRAETQVSGSDFLGRSCSGSLHGPLLMEDPLQVDSLDGRPTPFQSIDFVFENAQDFAPMRSASLALACLEPSVLHAPAGESPLATLPATDSSFAYFGVKNGVATIVQQFEQPQAPSSLAEPSQVRLPDGQVAYIFRGQGPVHQMSLHLPASSLDDLAGWGRGFLAFA